MEHWFKFDVDKAIKELREKENGCKETVSGEHKVGYGSQGCCQACTAEDRIISSDGETDN